MGRRLIPRQLVLMPILTLLPGQWWSERQFRTFTAAFAAGTAGDGERAITGTPVTTVTVTVDTVEAAAVFTVNR